MGETGRIVHIALNRTACLCRFRRTEKQMRQNRNTPKDFISDLAQIANGAASAFGSLRAEMDVIRASRTDRAAAAGGSVTREDFDAALTRIDALAARIAALEADLNALKTAAARPARPAKARAAKSAKKT